MMAKILFATTMLCMFAAGFAGGRGWRMWGDDLEIEPGVVTLTVLFLLLAFAFAAAGGSVT
jgi:hypothetical protein